MPDAPTSAPTMAGPAHLLIVDDEAMTTAHLRDGWSEAGFAVDVCGDGRTALSRLRTREYDLVVLDIVLPAMDGRDVLRTIRAEANPVPVLMLTACDDLASRVAGLNLGADDYLVKPFAFTELLARIRTVLRRDRPRSATSLAIADLEVDLLNDRVARGGRRIDLTPTEFSLLVLLIRHRGTPLSRRAIARQVWGVHNESESNVVEVAIKRLRAKVDDAFPLKLIHTVRGVGYVCGSHE
jgi:two-component system copper resistance phosphate regulon response regulator CusR